MKSLLTIGLVWATHLVFAEAALTRVLVRQQWPWNDGVRVDFELSGADAAGVDLGVAVRSGSAQADTAAVAAALTEGTLHGVQEGLGHFTFDPKTAFGSAETTHDLQVTLTITGRADPLANRIEYRIFDLVTGEIKDLRRRDFYDHPEIYGGFTTNYATIGTDFVSPLADTFIWTGVNKGTEYKIDKLVMKRVPAADVVWWMGPPDDTVIQDDNLYETRFQVRFSKDYYIGVFELTAGQHERITGWDPSFFTNQPHHAWAPVHQVDMRVVMNASTGFCAMASAKFGKTIRLPYEAEWEYAAKAGYDGDDYPNGKARTLANLSELEGCKGGSGSSDRSSPYFPYAVGSGLPNPMGLYNMFANVRECMGELSMRYLLNYYTDTREMTQPFLDPHSLNQDVGVEAYPFKGADFNQFNCTDSRPSYRKAFTPTQFQNPAKCYGTYGCRVLCVAD